jgi:hypothetical protein
MTTLRGDCGLRNDREFWPPIQDKKPSTSYSDAENEEEDNEEEENHNAESIPRQPVGVQNHTREDNTDSLS